MLFSAELELFDAEFKALPSGLTGRSLMPGVVITFGCFLLGLLLKHLELSDPRVAQLFSSRVAFTYLEGLHVLLLGLRVAPEPVIYVSETEVRLRVIRVRLEGLLIF